MNLTKIERLRWLLDRTDIAMGEIAHRLSAADPEAGSEGAWSMGQAHGSILAVRRYLLEPAMKIAAEIAETGPGESHGARRIGGRDAGGPIAPMGEGVA